MVHIYEVDLGLGLIPTSSLPTVNVGHGHVGNTPSIKREHYGDAGWISRRIIAPTAFSGRFESEFESDYRALVDLTCEWNRTTLHYDVKRIEFTRRPNGEPVTGRLLRQIPVEEIAQRFASSAINTWGVVESAVFKEALPFPTAISLVLHKAPELRGPDQINERLECVAFLYEAESVFGLKPTQAIANAFNVSPRTATNWIREAREAGFIEPLPTNTESAKENGSPA